MKVRELIEKLKKFDTELNVLCYCEDKDILQPNHSFRLFCIEDFSLIKGEEIRGQDNIPTLKLCSSEETRIHIAIDITSNF